MKQLQPDKTDTLLRRGGGGGRTLRAVCALCTLALLWGCAAGEAAPAAGSPAASSSMPSAAEGQPLGEVLMTEDPATETGLQNGWGQRQYHAVYTEGSGGRCFERWLSVPYTDRTGPAYDAIGAFFQAEVQAQREECAGLIAAHITPEMLGGTAGWCYADRAWTPLWENDRLISFSGGDEGYTGGAHGWDNAVFAVFDLADGSRLRLPDLFTDAKRGLRALTQDVLEQIGETESASVSRRAEAEKLLGQEGFQTDNFALNRQGVVLRFNPYDIDCYAAGGFTYAVPYERLSAYLRPELFGDG